MPKNNNGLRQSKPEILRKRIIMAVTLLMKQEGYGQNTIVAKLQTLGYKIATATMSNLLNDKIVGIATLKKTEEGILTIIRQELGKVYDEAQARFIDIEATDWQPKKIIEKSTNSSTITIYPKGRVLVEKKAAFISVANRQLIEVGIRLNAFTGYIYSNNESVYKTPIRTLLEQGVNIQLYILDPESEAARIYFLDRSQYISTEKDAIEDIRKVIERLKLLVGEFDELNLPGKLDIFLYSHIPVSMMLGVDIDEENGKMMVAPYLYGIRRADCPVMEFSRKEHPELFEKYKKSLLLTIEGAKKID